MLQMLDEDRDISLPDKLKLKRFLLKFIATRKRQVDFKQKFVSAG